MYARAHAHTCLDTFLIDFHISHPDLSLGFSSVEEGYPENYLLHFFVLSERDSRGFCIWKRAGVWVALSQRPRRF